MSCIVSAAIQCFSDLACGTEIGTQKNTPEECCNSFDDNGVEGVAYMQGDTCEDCAFITGDAIVCVMQLYWYVHVNIGYLTK